MGVDAAAGAIHTAESRKVPVHTTDTGSSAWSAGLP
jgi:hypothetical protein